MLSQVKSGLSFFLDFPDVFGAGLPGTSGLLAGDLSAITHCVGG